MVNGINHITFAVSNLDTSVSFYQKLLGLKLVLKWNAGAYLLAGNIWIALNVDKNTRRKPVRDYSHIAFSVLSTEYNKLLKRLQQAGVKSFKNNTSEGDSFYFLDPDGHKLEIHYNTLEHRLEYLKVNNSDLF